MFANVTAKTYSLQRLLPDTFARRQLAALSVCTRTFFSVVSWLRSLVVFWDEWSMQQQRVFLCVFRVSSLSVLISVGHVHLQPTMTQS